MGGGWGSGCALVGGVMVGFRRGYHSGGFSWG